MTLLCLGILKLYKGDNFSLENLEDIIFQKNVIGLLSSGLVISNKNKLEIKPLFI